MNTNSPVIEMRSYLSGWESIARAKRKFCELMGIEAAQDIAADIVTHQRTISTETHKAEVYDLEAVRLFDEAQSEKSEGGKMITPTEAKKIRCLVMRSAELDHNVSEMASV